MNPAIMERTIEVELFNTSFYGKMRANNREIHEI